LGKRLALCLFNLGTALSLLGAAAACSLWAWTYRTPEVAELEFAGIRWRVTSAAGWLSADNLPHRTREVERQKREYAELPAKLQAELDAIAVSRPGQLPESTMHEYEAAKKAFDHLLIVYPSRLVRARTPAVRHSVPHARVATGAAVLPLAWLALRVCSRLRLRRRKPPGHCRVCGYDLRASRGRCPECATPPRGWKVIGAPP
jgi:hypothetical protein